jgi:hypothetical protein
MKQFFVAATRQNEGKTTVALGLTAVLVSRNYHVGFIKPVGQRYVESGGYKVDEDSILMSRAFNLDCHIKDMSPVAIVRGFTKKFVASGDTQKLIEEIRAAYSRVSQGKQYVVIEGTGHAGVGSILNLSNADVASLLGSKVIIVTRAGIGRPVDEVMLNHCLFASRGAQVLGVILNKAEPEKIDQVKQYTGKALEDRGLKLLGVIPYIGELMNPTMDQIREELQSELLNGEAFLSNTVGPILVGAMSPHRALDYISGKALCITPSDRGDIILAAMSSCLAGISKEHCVSGMLLTGGAYPHPNIMKLVQKTNIPVLLTNDDSYTAAAKVHDMTVKIRPSDKKKISLARRLIRNYVDVDYILEHA